MTARSETIRMSLYTRITKDGLSADQQHRLFIDELTLYRNALAHEVARWEGDPQLRGLSDSDRDLQAFEALWGAFARTGIVDAPSAEYAAEHFHDLDEEEQGRLRRLIREKPGFRTDVAAEASAAMARVGISPTAANLRLGSELVMLARMMGAWACRNGVEVTSALEGRMPAAVTAPTNLPRESSPATIPDPEIPPEQRDLTPTQSRRR